MVHIFYSLFYINIQWILFNIKPDFSVDNWFALLYSSPQLHEILEITSNLAFHIFYKVDVL